MISETEITTETKILELPQINLDDINSDDIKDALTNWGTFELVGSTINKLRSLAKNALETSEKLFKLSKEELQKVADKPDRDREFHGYQNVRKETKESALLGKGPVRSQKAFHYKPYKKEQRIPEGLDATSYSEYYMERMKVLQRLYKAITEKIFTIDPARRSGFENDDRSVLTARKYKKPKKEGETGIPPHSDFGLLTLVVSDQPGLEVYKNRQWVAAPSGPDLRFYINVGDWSLIQLNNESFTVGLHRVPEVKDVRHSLALFLNPGFSEELATPKGGKVTFGEYLKHNNKSAYFAKGRVSIKSEKSENKDVANSVEQKEDQSQTLKNN